jgi:adenine deaminase
MLGQGGMTPLEAIRCATIGGAWYLGLDQILGSLEPGKARRPRRDEEEPLEDLTQSDSIEFVLANGRMYEAATMAQIHPESKPRPHVAVGGRGDFGPGHRRSRTSRQARSAIGPWSGRRPLPLDPFL